MRFLCLYRDRFVTRKSAEVAIEMDKKEMSWIIEKKSLFVL